MPDYAVSTAFTAKDQGIIDAYERMGRSADEYGDRASRAFSKVGGSADHASASLRNATKHGYNFGAIVKGIVAANMIHGAVSMVGHAIKDTTKEYLSFDDEISQAVAKFSDLGPHVKGFEGHVMSLGKAVRKVGVESKFPLEQLASGVNQIARSKIFQSQDAITALIPLMHLNIDAQEDFGESTRNIMGMMGAWALKTDSAAQTMANYKEMVNLVSFANNSALVSVTDLAETMKTVGPAARSMGYGLRDVTAMTTFLARAGIKGTEASTALRNIFMHLARPDFVQDLANLKIPIVENGKFRPLRDFFMDLEKFTNKLQPAKAKAFLDILFGMRGSSGGNDILRQIKEYSHLEDQMKNVKNEMDDMADRLGDTKLNRIERFKNKLTDKTWQIFDKYADGFAESLNRMMAAVDRFDMKPVLQFLSSTGYILGVVYQIASPFLPLLPWIAAGFWGIKLATAAIAWAPLVGGFFMLAIEATKVLGILNLLKVAWLTLNASFVGTPLGVAAMIALGVGSSVYSLATGKDNPLSRLAQDIGIVPTLDHDAEGHVVAPGAAPGPRVDQPPAVPGQADAVSEPVSIRNQRPGNGVVTVRFENAPPGTTAKGSVTGQMGLSIDDALLGRN